MGVSSRAWRGNTVGDGEPGDASRKHRGSSRGGGGPARLFARPSNRRAHVEIFPVPSAMLRLSLVLGSAGVEPRTTPRCASQSGLVDGRKRGRWRAGALVFPVVADESRRRPKRERLTIIKKLRNLFPSRDSHGRRPRHRAQVGLRGPLERRREALLAGELKMRRGG